MEEVAITSPAIEFADANVKALCVANWDTNGDGELSEEEAAAVSDLSYVFKENTTITSFNELQYFTGLTGISNYAFNRCSNLAAVTLPSTITSIGMCAFDDCYALAAIDIPSCVTFIDGAAFSDCRNLTSIILPEGITSIGDWLLDGCIGLTEITIPESVTSIGNRAFARCSGLTHITIPNNVTSIGCKAFDGCSNLTSVTMPASVITFDGNEGNAFGQNNNIEAVYISDLTAWLNTSFPMANNPLRCGARLYLNNVEVKDLVIPDGTTAILSAAFEGCESLTSVTIPNSVTNIDGWAFASCSNLTTVTIAESVTSIGDCVFKSCYSLTDVWCYAVNIPGTADEVFTNTPIGDATLHVPSASFIAYSTTAPWSSFGTIIPIDGFVINDETTSFSIAVEESGKAVVHTHQFTGDWEALYLPFAIDYDAIRADFDLAEIDGVVQNDDNNDGIADITVLSIMGFKEQMTEPNTPYLIRAKNAGEQTIVFDDVTVYPTEAATFECSSFSKRYEFTGSYNTLGASALANRYVVQGGELVKGASSLAPCRWYMTAISKTGGALNLPARIRIMPVEDVITGSPFLTSLEEEGQVYNLAGQRLNKVQKGINIVGGKKILIK